MFQGQALHDDLVNLASPFHSTPVHGSDDLLSRRIEVLDQLLDLVLGHPAAVVAYPHRRRAAAVLDEEVDTAVFRHGGAWFLQRLVGLAKAKELVDSTNATLDQAKRKELFARAIHGLSHRSRRPFVAINCAAIPDSLIESELFGHERGSFTGAMARRLGKFELADGGTVFLDEIGELSPATQGKLLRVLQERSFHRVGGTISIQVDVRILAASNRPLDRMVSQGLFREDLYYRVRVFPIRIPPLRDRPEDVDPLVDWFLGHLPQELGKKEMRIAAPARERLRAYEWPGNVRELRNCLERAIILSDGGVIEERSLRLAPDVPEQPAERRGETLEDVRERGARTAERLWLARALERAKGDRTAAATELGLTQRRFEAKLKEHSLDE